MWDGSCQHVGQKEGRGQACRQAVSVAGEQVCLGNRRGWASVGEGIGAVGARPR